MDSKPPEGGHFRGFQGDDIAAIVSGEREGKGKGGAMCGDCLGGAGEGAGEKGLCVWGWCRSDCLRWREGGYV